jgi:hypothetical protein
MRRRELLVGAVVATLGGCSTRGHDGRDRSGNRTTPTPTARSETVTATDTPSPSPATGTAAGVEDAGDDVSGKAVESAREHLAVAFDELREMRPVGSENIRVSADRFRASDHERVREELSATTTALDRIGTADGDTEVRGLRAALDLAREGVALYGAVRRAFRAEWRFERHGYGAEWAEASVQADRATTAIAAWEDHGDAVAEAAVSVRDAGGVSIPRLVPRAWYRDGTVLSSVAGPWADVAGGFGAFAEAVGLDEVGIDAMDAGEHDRARDRFGSAADGIGEAHRRLAAAKAEGAQAFQAYALPIRRRCGPLREAYTTQVEAATVAARGESDRADELWTGAMDRIVTTEIEHPLPEP